MHHQISVIVAVLKVRTRQEKEQYFITYCSLVLSDSLLLMIGLGLVN